MMASELEEAVEAAPGMEGEAGLNLTSPSSDGGASVVVDRWEHYSNSIFALLRHLHFPRNVEKFLFPYDDE